MASVRAGDILNFSWYGRSFDIAAGDANVNVMTGKKTNEASLNGNGTLHVTQRLRAPGFTDLPISIDDERGDLEFLQEKADAGAPGPCVMTLASGVDYEGSLVPVGDIQKATGDGTATLEGRGPKFEKV